jgi:hypothetical protein
METVTLEMVGLAEAELAVTVMQRELQVETLEVLELVEQAEAEEAAVRHTLTVT